MNFLIIILLVIVTIIVFLFIIGLFSGKQYSVQRQVLINQPKQQVFSYLKISENAVHYNKWWQMDPNVRRLYTGVDGTVGFIAAWDSDDKQAGKGEQETTKITEGERIDYEIRFIKPFENTTQMYIKTTEVSLSETSVKWVFNGKMKYPMNIMLLFLNMDNMLGKDMDTSLQTLKSILEG